MIKSAGISPVGFFILIILRNGRRALLPFFLPEGTPKPRSNGNFESKGSFSVQENPVCLYTHYPKI